MKETTGLCGWIFLSSGWGNTHGPDGTLTGQYRQIPDTQTGAGSPQDGMVKVDDVTFEAMAASCCTPGCPAHRHPSCQPSRSRTAINSH